MRVKRKKRKNVNKNKNYLCDVKTPDRNLMVLFEIENHKHKMTLIDSILSTHKKTEKNGLFFKTLAHCKKGQRHRLGHKCHCHLIVGKAAFYMSTMATMTDDVCQHCDKRVSELLIHAPFFPPNDASKVSRVSEPSD